MAGKITARLPRGMRDMLPQDMIKRQYVMNVIQGVFEEFGFELLQTPAIEMTDTLTGKYGPDAERLIYRAFYGPGRSSQLSLRYDLSVPLCRVMAMYPDLIKPFKRYQIAPVWRADRPQKGRYREFYQCDADTVGSASMLADAEIINVIYEILTRLGFENFVINVNDRKILKGIGQFAGVPEGLMGGLYRSIDKLSKIGLEGTRRELQLVGLPEEDLDALRRTIRLFLQGEFGPDDLAAQAVENRVPEKLAERVAVPLRKVLLAVDRDAIEPDRVQEMAGELVGRVARELRAAYADELEMIPDDAVNRLLDLLQVSVDGSSGGNRSILAALREQLADYPIALEGIAELEEIIRYLNALGIPEAYYQVDFAMVRGLEYYTGPIYETVVKEPAIGSITGGGRYDGLIGMFMDRSYPATGTTIGIERIIDVMEELDMFPSDVGQTVTQVLVTQFDPDLLTESLKMATELRQAGLNTELYFESDRLGEQIRYALKKGIPYVVILGPDELAAGRAAIRNLLLKEQDIVPREEAAARINTWRQAQ
jgi:histidyl-tRNA synthetase